MDSDLALFVIVDAALVCFAIWTILSPQSVWGLTTAWKYRNSEAMEPSARRYRMIRASGAAQLSIWVPPLVGLAWPGDVAAKLSAGAATGVILILVIISVLVIVFSVGAKRRREQALIAEVPVSELSETAYDIGWFEVGYTFVYAVVVGFLVVGAVGAGQSNASEYLAGREATLSPEQRAEYLPLVIRTGFDVLPAVPEGALIGYPGEYILKGDDLTFSRYERSCASTGFVVIETAETVAVGIVYDASGADAVGQTAGEFCPATGQTGDPKEQFTVSLAAELGDRKVIAADDGRLIFRDYGY